MLAWLSLWSKMQTCIWPSWCHCHSLSLASVKSRSVLPFWYRLTWVVPEKGPLNGCVCVLTMPLGMQTSSIRGLSQAMINWDGCGRKSIQHKNGGWWRWGSNSLCGIASKQAVGAFASAICPCAIKCRRWWAVMEKVDKWFSEFCITVGTARTASILIHSLLKALAVNMSRPSGRLWLYAGLIGSNSTCWLKAL